MRRLFLMLRFLRAILLAPLCVPLSFAVAIPYVCMLVVREMVVHRAVPTQL